MTKNNAYGVYYIFKSMEQGANLPHQHAEIPHQGPALPHPCPPAQSLYALLLLHPR